MIKTAGKWVGLSFGVLGLAVGASWVADAAAEGIKTLLPSPEARWVIWAWLGIGMLVFLISIWGLYKLRKGFIVTNAKLVDDHPHRVHTLIMGLSKPREDQGDLEEIKEKSFCDVIKKDGLNKQHPWQQNLRMVHKLIHGMGCPCAASLKEIHVIPSKESRDSAEEFKTILTEKLLEKGCSGVTVKIYQGYINYEKINDVQNEVNNIIMEVKKSEDNCSVLIDITSGTKIFSIAAALVAMNEDQLLGYVDNDGNAQIYQCRLQMLGHFGE